MEESSVAGTLRFRWGQRITSQAPQLLQNLFGLFQLVFGGIAKGWIDVCRIDNAHGHQTALGPSNQATKGMLALDVHAVVNGLKILYLLIPVVGRSIVGVL